MNFFWKKFRRRVVLSFCCYWCNCMDCSSTQGWISYMYVDVCAYICSRMIRMLSVFQCVCVWVLRYLMCLLYLHHVVDIMDFLFMLSAYAGCPELKRFSLSILFPSINIEGHIVGMVNCTCTILHQYFELSWTSFWRCSIFLH